MNLRDNHYTKPVSNTQDNQNLDLPPPPGISVERQGDELIITRRASIKLESWGCQFLMLLFTFGWLSVCIAPIGYSFYATIVQSSWLWGALGLGLVALTCLTRIIYLKAFVRSLTDELILINRETIKIRSGSWFLNLLWRRNFNRNDIKYLYVKNRNVEAEKENILFNKTHKLIAITDNDQETTLTVLSPIESLYLKHVLEQFLKLENEPIAGEIIPLFEAQAIRYAPWKSWAQRHDLIFDNRGVEVSLLGLYRDNLIKLKASPRDGLFFSEIHIHLQVSAATTLEEDDEVQALTPKDVINLFNVPESVHLTEQISIDSKAQIVSYEANTGEDNPEPFMETQQFLVDRCCELVQAYPKIVQQGGTIISTLQSVLKQNNKPFKSIIRQLLHDIAIDTTNRLANPPQRLICSSCFSAPTSYNAQIGESESFTYYACRTCQQSQTFLSASEAVIAILDQNMTVRYEKQGVRYLRVSWLHQQTLFDFDAVEIIQATDEEVERFVVQVGNDTDRLRIQNYRNMKCTVVSKCQLSENTFRILYRMFGQVEVQKY